MAKRNINDSYSNATFHYEDMAIVEVPKKKDEQPRVYSLDKILQGLDGMTGLSITFKSDSEIEPDSTEY